MTQAKDGKADSFATPPAALPDNASMNLDFEVTSAKPAWLRVTLPDGEQWRISVATMVKAVKAKKIEGETSFDLDLRWEAKWEKI